jgi:predicted secreted protein
MGVTGSIVVYVVVWWLVFFAVLPWGVRSHRESGEDSGGVEPGAPVNPGLARKAAVTSIIAAVIWAAIFLAVRMGVFDFYPEAPLT